MNIDEVKLKILDYTPYIKRKLARYSRYPGQTLEDHYHSCLIEIYRDIESYDPEKGSIGTWVIWRVRSYMSNFRSMRQKKKRYGQTISIPIGRENDHEEMLFNKLEALMSETPDYSSMLISGPINEAFSKLKPSHQDILFRRFVLDETLDEVAKAYNLSKERVRQIEGKSLSKIRQSLGLEQPRIDRRRRPAPDQTCPHQHPEPDVPRSEGSNSSPGLARRTSE